MRPARLLAKAHTPLGAGSANVMEWLICAQRVTLAPDGCRAPSRRYARLEVLGAHSVRNVTSFRQWREEQSEGRLALRESCSLPLSLMAAGRRVGYGFEGDGERWSAGARCNGQHRATQVRASVKINTPVTRTRRHSPAHGGTSARISA